MNHQKDSMEQYSQKWLSFENHYPTIVFFDTNCRVTDKRIFKKLKVDLLSPKDP
jgi:hypothetical protein